MKPKNTKQQRFLHRTRTIFASLSRRLTKGVGLFSTVTNRPRSEYPKTQQQREALRPDLYLELRIRIEKLIAAREELEKYCRRMKHPLAKDPGKSTLVAAEHFRELDVIELWALLEKFHLLPVDGKLGIMWPSWKSFVRTVRRDDSVFDRLKQVACVAQEEEPAYA